MDSPSHAFENSLNAIGPHTHSFLKIAIESTSYNNKNKIK
jgi:hypothetical protein